MLFFFLLITSIWIELCSISLSLHEIQLFKSYRFTTLLSVCRYRLSDLRIYLLIFILFITVLLNYFIQNIMISLIIRIGIFFQIINFVWWSIPIINRKILITHRKLNIFFIIFYILLIKYLSMNIDICVIIINNKNWIIL